MQFFVVVVVEVVVVGLLSGSTSGHPRRDGRRWSSKSSGCFIRLCRLVHGGEADAHLLLRVPGSRTRLALLALPSGAGGLAADTDRGTGSPSVCVPESTIAILLLLGGPAGSRPNLVLSFGHLRSHASCASPHWGQCFFDA